MSPEARPGEGQEVVTDKVDIFMPLFIGDYLKDTVDLSAEEHGAYLLLLMNLWNRGGRLPCDPPRLARMAGLSLDRWEPVWMTVGRFFEFDDGHIHQPRLSRELKRAAHKKNQAVEKGRQGAAKCWGNGPSNAPAISSAIAEGVANRCSPPSPSQEDQIPPNPPRGTEAASYPEEFERFWAATNKRGSKHKAFESWKRQGKPPADALVARWRLWQQTDDWRRGFEKHPVSWLNGRMHLQDPPLSRGPAESRYQTLGG
jgi:uncharacterized protein YdaU (DUF1376 family)